MNTLTQKCLLAFVVIGLALVATDQASAFGHYGGCQRAVQFYDHHRHANSAPQVIRHAPSPVGVQGIIQQPVGQIQQVPQQIQQPFGQAPAPQIAPQPGQGFNGIQQAPPAVNQFRRGPQPVGQAPAPQLAPQPGQGFNGIQQAPPAVNQIRRGPQPVGQPVLQQGTPQQNALQMLSGFGTEPQVNSAPTVGPQFPQSQPISQPISQPLSQTQFSEVGTWKATVSNGAVVQLELNANRQFVWKAVSNGKLSTFSGNFNITNGTLTLARSTDSKKLVGSMTPNGLEGFTFQLQGANDNGLQFTRS